MKTSKSNALGVQVLESRAVLTTFFVDPSGQDSSAGTSGAPWATLQHAVDSVRAGDTIAVQSGTYAGCRIGSSGTAAAPITLKAAPGAHVVVDRPGPSNRHGSDIEVENFAAASSAQGPAYWTIDGLEVMNAPMSSGIDIRVTNHITVQNVYSHHNAYWGILVSFSDYPVITHNHCAYSVNQHGMYIANSGDYATVTYNEVDHNYGSGIQFNGDVSLGGKGYMVGNVIGENIIHDNGVGGGGALNLGGIVNSRVENNLIYNNHANGIALFNANAAVGSHDNVIVNNTIVMPVDARWGVNINSGATSNHLSNNIIVQQNRARLRGCIMIDASSLSGFTSDSNVFSGNVSFSIDGSSTVLTQAQWQAKTGQDKLSKSATTAALFASFATNDFRLKAGSPAIAGGSATNAPTIDLTGKLRPTGVRPSVGCYAA